MPLHFASPPRCHSPYEYRTRLFSLASFGFFRESVRTTGPSIIEHIERYNHVFSAFADHGISVFAFDQRGFGRTAQKTKTQGMTTMTDQLRDLEFFLAAEAKEAKLADQKLYLMGHSMVGQTSLAPLLRRRLSTDFQGGGIVLTYATRKDDRARPTLAKLDGLIASAPMIEQPPGFRANRLLLKVGGRVGWLLPSLQMKIDIKKDVSLNSRIPEREETYI